MDKQALRRRNKLLKKNKERMDILMGISKVKEIEKDEENELKIEKRGNADDNDNTTEQADNQNSNDKKQENEKLKNSNLNTMNEIDTSPVAISNSDTSNDIALNANQTNEEGDKTSQNSDTLKNKKNVPSNGKNNIKKDENCLTQSNDKKERSNLKDNSKEEKNKDIDKTKDNNSKLDSNDTKENENITAIKVDGKKKIQFFILIICSMLISLLKRKFYDNKKIVYIDKSFINQKMIFRFMNSKFFLIFFSFLYNLLFSLIDIRSYLKKKNMTIYEIVENIKNIRNKFKNESEALFFLLNNGSTFSIFFVNIIKSYILFMFLTHLFDDIFHSYSVFTSTPIFQKVNVI
ncbi:conserved Plasmodium protein, unknown function [Plasmodium berghei]|uniref:Uncharacterized protein n=2 Tax=Plasmodium berghei TaxID=5821 RepID=A0A509AEF5_PLABA|nr:conserved Plasmodium protein, unknown function [Plasmodium berghei ANKA]CXH95961.1 conserved Plasmodium protein, unknown function [Plasmodium berghei]SCL91086.1 conserved Plasmodium protein, unknown function [Plasmodium berghei]SCM15421.1 conserved Plasmodium protein, unknown function [Plasmodium berghei]SCM17216.1 conserved Plasmodium protein, unknown function [Plasmodium berghei]SCN22295.1 conserved Plasmodium protein, unknown function [Plasmodium berghei]|eukprot:XP_034420006.1 conserved Plasmodium protein, unknown function [Plasmodium berghei ANKA]